MHVTVASVSNTLFDGIAESVTLPGTAGEMTVLKNHEPLMSTLTEGTITIRCEGEETTHDIEGGLVEISGGRCIVLL